ncbi:MAG: hypothetical protein KC425_02740, partial [Anaerolineales bacterium]|nr:hypothetical protein [Anaerolineales bacterium]
MKRAITVFGICFFSLLLLVGTGIQLAAGAAAAARSGQPGGRRPAATIVITSTADAGPGTLRQALLLASSGDIITFDPAIFPPAVPMTIYIAMPLPVITQGNLTIDASNAGVVLDGVSAVISTTDGLAIESDGNVIMGLQILHFPHNGIRISNGASLNQIGGDRTTGTAPNGQGNILTRNHGAGIKITGGASASNTIQGNLIGLDTNGGVYLRTYELQVSHNFGADGTLFAGTEISGVFRTTNGGSSWTAVNAGMPLTAVQAIALSPGFAGDETLFAAGPGGVARSTDGGGSWTAVNSGLTDRQVRDLVVSPHFASDQTLFAATHTGVFRSADGGSSWSAASSGLPGQPVAELALSPNFAGDQTLFAAMSTGVYRSIDAGG